MLRLLVITAALAAASPALAETTLTIDNRGSVAVSGINSFPIGDDGEPVEDNIGGLFDDVPPGSTATFDLTGDCGPVRVFVRLAGRSGDDLEIDIDTCNARTIVVTD